MKKKKCTPQSPTLKISLVYRTISHFPRYKTYFQYRKLWCAIFSDGVSVGRNKKEIAWKLTVCMSERRLNNTFHLMLIT